MWRAQQLAIQFVSPAVQGADNVLGMSASFQHDGLAMSADIGKQFNTLRIAHQHLGVIQPRQYMVITLIGHHQFMADIVGTGIKQHALFHLQYLGVKVPAQGWLRRYGRKLFDFGYFRHGLTKPIRYKILNKGRIVL